MDNANKLATVWDASDLVKIVKDNEHSDRLSKNAVVNEEGRKLLEYGRRISVEILNGK